MPNRLDNSMNFMNGRRWEAFQTNHVISCELGKWTEVGSSIALMNRNLRLHPSAFMQISRKFVSIFASKM